MINKGLKSESTGNSYKKLENMWDYCSDDTGAFPKLKNTERNYIDGASEAQLVTILNVFRTWMLSQFKTVLDGKKTMLESKSNLEDYWNSLCYV